MTAIGRLRAQTACARCGGRPIEWHGEHHPARPGRRISNMVGAGYKLDDGRTAALLAASPTHQETPIPAKPCRQCGQPYKPLRSRCRDRARSGRKRNRGHEGTHA